MLNCKLKKEALYELKDNVDFYQDTYVDVSEHIILLYEQRITSVQLISNVERFINALANTPKEFKKVSEEIRVNRIIFESKVSEIESKSKHMEMACKGVACSGVAAGAGVVVFGPTLALAVATTFGTASTGTAIATLSGAAATNAALAWLGGGALAVGGGGMAAGNVFLALAGPVGWAIGAGILAGSGAIAFATNKQIALKAENEIIEVKKETAQLWKIKEKIDLVTRESAELFKNVDNLLSKMNSCNIQNYLEFSNDQLQEIIILLNSTLTLSKKISEQVEDIV